jgi:hypothetical protein
VTALLNAANHIGAHAPQADHAKLHRESPQ